MPRRKSGNLAPYSVEHVPDRLFIQLFAFELLDWIALDITLLPVETTCIRASYLLIEIPRMFILKVHQIT